MSRFACLWVDFFAASAAERCDPVLRMRPLAVLTAAMSVRRVLDANAAARSQGVRPGATETEARARCPALVSRPWGEEQIASGRHALLEAASSVSPRVEDWGPGIVHIDAAGLTRLFGDLPAVGRRLLRQAQAVGFSARVAFADSRTAARVVASGASSAVTIVPPGHERAALAGAPLDVLGLDADLTATLARWGVTTLGALAALPRDGLGTRLGPAGLQAHDTALGLDRDAFTPWAPSPFWGEAQGLDWEIESLADLVTVLATVLERLCVRLAAARLAADALEVSLELASRGHHTLAVPLAAPMDEPKPMLTLVALELEARPPEAPVTRVTVSAHPVGARARQRGFWQPLAPPSRELGAVLARLGALAGPANVGAPRIEDSHRPDAHAVVPFAPPPEELGMSCRSRARDGAWQGALRLALRRVRPPRRVRVETNGEQPMRVDGQGVVARAGPWRGSGEWWDARGWARDEWDVALGDGMLCRLTHDHRTGEWHLDGIYD